jgi:hypothetical protein
MPMVVRPVALAAPGADSASYTVKFGFDGAFSATGRGSGGGRRQPPAQ